jgi:hypothetical protein
VLCELTIQNKTKHNTTKQNNKTQATSMPNKASELKADKRQRFHYE